MCRTAHTAHVTSARVMKCTHAKIVYAQLLDHTLVMERTSISGGKCTHCESDEASSVYASTSLICRRPDHSDVVCKQTVRAVHKHKPTGQRSCPLSTASMLHGNCGTAARVCTHVARERYRCGPVFHLGVYFSVLWGVYICPTHHP